MSIGKSATGKVKITDGSSDATIGSVGSNKPLHTLIPDQQATGSIAGNGQSITVDFDNRSGCLIDISGTFTGTVSVTASADGVVFHPFAGIIGQDLVVAFDGTDTNNYMVMNVGGMSSLRLTGSGWVSGTCNIAINLSASTDPLGFSYIIGSSTSANLANETGGNLATIAGAVSGAEMQVDVVAPLPAGTNAIGKLAANSGVDIGDVDVTSVVPGTGATNLGKAIDSNSGGTDTGVVDLAVRDDALTTLTPADGDYVPKRTNARGAQWIAVEDGSGGQVTNFGSTPFKSGDLTFTNTTGQMIDISQASALRLSFHGTWSGTFVITGTNDESTTNSALLNVYTEPGGSLTNSITTNGSYYVDCSGWEKIEITPLVFSSGTCNINWGASGGSPYTYTTVIGSSAIVSVTPTISTSAYTAEDQIGGLQTLSGATRLYVGTATLYSVTVLDKAKINSDLDVYFFNASPTVTSSDNAALNISDSEMADKCIGYVRILASNYSNLSANSVVCERNLGLLLSTSSPTSSTLYAIAKINNAGTYASTSDLVFKYHFLRD